MIAAEKNAALPQVIRRIGFALPAATVCIVLMSGVMKFYDLGEFHSGLQSWNTLPVWAAGVATFAVPVAEVGCGLWWVLGVRRRLASTALFALLSMFTLAYSWQAWAAAPPDCACFGKIRAFENLTHYVRGIVPRNLLLQGLLLPAILLPVRSRSSKS